MKVTFLGPAYPYRGGIATIIERLAREFQTGWRSDSGVTTAPADVEVLTFRVQYPRWLFPGRTQFRTGAPPPDLTIERAVSTINPFNWLAVGRRIGRGDGSQPSPRKPAPPQPHLVVLKYWTPFMAPCFGVIARVARHTARRRAHHAHQHGLAPVSVPRFVVQLDNVVPHERHWWDDLLTRFFVRSMDGFVAMSSSVERDLVAAADGSLPARPRRSVRVVLSPHPLFDNFGKKVPRGEACARLGLDPTQKYAMFFGLVREYKGLDLLLEAFRGVVDAFSEGRPPHLLVVGEFYDDPAKYDPARFGLSANEVTVHPEFVPDDEVRLWFSVADALILPYRSATQSGVTQIAYHFDVPMIVTDVGGLPEIVRDGTVGFVVEPTVESLRAAIEKIFDLTPANSPTSTPANAPVSTPSSPSSPVAGDTLDKLRANFPAEKQRFGWPAAADAILRAAGLSDR